MSDPAHIAQARSLIAQGPGGTVGSIVSARIAPGPDGLNRDVRAIGEPLWSWYISEFLGFADAAIELCDGWPGFIQQDVAAFIANTNSTICFWGYTVKRELASAPRLRINEALDGAWYNPQYNGQGLFIDVMAERNQIFLGWFTFAQAGTATIGDPAHRWLTAQGAFGELRVEIRPEPFDLGDSPALLVRYGFSLQREHVVVCGVGATIPGLVDRLQSGLTPPIEVKTPEAFEPAVATALGFDRKVVVEAGVPDPREIECGVLGNDDPEASVAGEVVPSREFYDYEAKYLDEASQTIVPADLTPGELDDVRRLSIEAFTAIDACGLARVDFLLSRATGVIVLNEINTMPGFTAASMYPMLWKASGRDWPAVVDTLIALARGEHADNDNDEMLEDEVAEEADAYLVRTVALLTPEGTAEGNPFAREYLRLLHDRAEVTMAHAAVMRVLRN